MVRFEQIDDVVLNFFFLVVVLHNVILMGQIIAVQSGVIVDQMQNIVIVQNVLTTRELMLKVRLLV